MKYNPNIASIADGREEITIRNSYSEEQINEFNLNHMNNAIKIAELKDEIAALNKAKKELSNKNNEIVETVKAGYADEKCDAFYINDFVENTREYYDRQGMLIKTRPLAPSERNSQQLKFVSNM